MSYPRSPYDLTGGLVYFARMCDKIRLFAAGDLPEDYHDNLGGGADGRMCEYLGVDYASLREQVLNGASDDQAFAWCQTHGHPLRKVDVLVWNGFSIKRGWRDEGQVADTLAKFKEGSGLSDRDDIVTFYDYFQVDEQRA